MLKYNLLTVGENDSEMTYQLGLLWKERHTRFPKCVTQILIKSTGEIINK